MKKTHTILTLLVGLMAFTSCGVQKAAVKDTVTLPSATKATPKAAKADHSQSLAFVQRVSDQKVYAQNIVSSMSFTATMGDKEITVPGSLHMRRDKVIRLQLFIPLLGSEVGRLEFTPDYVLVIDRMHKEYLKGDYNQLDFLRDNGLNFYSLQALFWNQLFLPGTQKVGEGDLSRYTVKTDEIGSLRPITLHNGNMTFTWKADTASARILQTDVNYKSAAHGNSSLVWLYSDFKALGNKMFPATQSFSFTTTATKKAQKCTVRLELGKLKTDSDWDEQSTVSDRYKQMDVKDVFGKILSM